MLKKYHSIGVGMTPSRTELGKFLRACRIELGLSQVQVAKISGVKQNFYSLLEIGKRCYPNTKKLEGLAKALKCDYSQLQSLAFLSKFADRRIKPTNSVFGQLVRARRQELGFNQAELAEKLRISRQFISQIELGQRRLSDSNRMIQQLTKALKLKAAKLQALKPQRKLKEIKKEEMGTITLGGFLASRRVELGLTQKKVAGCIGMSSSVISVIERSRRIPSSQILDKLKKVLECEIPAELL